MTHDTPREEDRSRGWQGRARARRLAEERKAGLLAERGWACLPPERFAALPEEVRLLLLAPASENTPPAA